MIENDIELLKMILKNKFLKRMRMLWKNTSEDFAMRMQAINIGGLNGINLDYFKSSIFLISRIYPLKRGLNELLMFTSYSQKLDLLKHWLLVCLRFR